jgi:putative transposase
LKERAKVQQILHHVSKQIVREAKRNQYGVAMENLTNLRKLYRRRNGQGAKYRFRLNSWSYAELQRQIEYKARWEGLPVILFYLRTRSWSLILLDRERRLA